jgi:ribonucleoside-diphosphate reductase beta chain
MATLKRIDPISVPGVENSLAIFDIPPTSVAFNKTILKEILPLMTVTRDGPYTFRLFSDSQFVDLSRTWFYLVTSLEKKDANGTWTAIDDTTDDDKRVGVINNFGSSFIKQLKININGVDVFNSGVLYAWRSYISHEYGISYDFRAGLSQAACYYPDEDKGQADVDNVGLKHRIKRFSNGTHCHTMAPLDFDLAKQSNLMLNNTDIVFTIWPNSNDFLILAPDYMRPAIAAKGRVGEAGYTEAQAAQMVANSTTYRVKVHEVKLYCTVVDVVQSLQNAIARQLETVPAKYPVRKVELRNLYLNEGRTEVTWNVFQSTIPRRLFVCLVRNDAYDGTQDRSPFNFEHGFLETIAVEVNNLVVPSVAYRFDFNNIADTNYIRAFVDLYTGLDLQEHEKEIQLTLKKFVNGWAAWVFPLSSFLKDTGDSFELIRNGSTVIKAHFKQPIASPGLEMICFAEFDQIITINSDRILSTDGSI